MQANNALWEDIYVLEGNMTKQVSVLRVMMYVTDIPEFEQ